MALKLTVGALTLPQLRGIARGMDKIAFAAGWQKPVQAAARAVAKAAAGDETIYGLNTGFGLLAQTNIPHDQLQELQVRLVRSHAAGTGPALDDGAVRLILALKANSLARGYSGVRPEVVTLLLEMLNRGVHPVIPAKGSAGASGDLAPLAALSAVMIGEGKARVGNRVLSGKTALKRTGLTPLTLQPKEGLALLNGTQVSTALALTGLFAAEDAFQAAVVAGALSIDAAKGSDTPFDPRIHAIRGQEGQIEIARVYKDLIAGSEIRDSHVDCDRVQDPYSLRCQPQVMGACLDQLRHAAEILRREANAVSDNPLVFAGTGDLLSGGNFHAEPVALAADVLALVIAETGALSERRVALLIDPQMSGLPAFLVAEPGINSGFMIAQVTAASLASENKSMAHPASVDSLPTSANQEDHVSMATFAGRRLTEMADNTAGIVAIELLAAAQGVEFHKPLKTSKPLAKAIAVVRDHAKSYGRDRAFTPEIDTLKAAIAAGRFNALPGAGLLPSLGASGTG